MIIPKIGQTIPKSLHSRDRILFVCDCGREKLISWKNYNANHTKSCGKCRSDKFKLDNIINKHFGQLKLANQDLPEIINKRTLLKWDCDCGNSKLIVASSVINGLTKSCGCKRSLGIKYIKPILYNKEHWLNTNKYLINIDLPDEWSAKSGIPCTFICKCGQTYTRRFFKWTEKSTCGKCNKINLKNLFGKQFGGLTIIDDRDMTIDLGSDELIKFRCKCGKEKFIKIGVVTRSNTTTCGSCNLRNESWWIGRKFGNLTVISAQKSYHLGSEERIECKCSCGNIVTSEIASLTRNHKKTCGSCREIGLKWWDTKLSPIYGGTSQIKNKYSLEYLTEYFEGSFLKPLSGADSSNHYSMFQCRLCNSEFKSKLTWIWKSKIVSCGCINHLSKGSIEIGQWLEKLNLNVKYGSNEEKINKYKVDIYLPDHKLAIEYHGLRYHSDRLDDQNSISNKNRQLEKAQIIKNIGINLIIIYEDEWKYKKNIFKDIILNKIGKRPQAIKIRPQKCEIKLIPNKETTQLYETYHYIGKCPSTYNIGTYYNNTLIACMSIKHPSRQLSGDWEISRMVCNHNYNIPGLWSYLLKWIKENKLINGKLITFSDNRISDGNVYNKMGMVKIGNVKPDYYWVKSNKRYHKSSLRKKGTEKTSGITESNLRYTQGYSKIWDYGKIKWEIII